MSKARRVKCDEGKPACAKCLSAARTCGGYQAPNSATLPLKMKFYVPPPQNLGKGLIPFQGTDQERRAFAFFCERTAKSFQSEFSTFYLLQAANEEPAIHHAVLALGGIHETCCLNKARLDGVFLVDPFSERRYVKAITLLLNTTKTSSEHPAEVFLICCILFACFESLRGHKESALSHVRCGLKLLRETATTDISGGFAYVPDKTLLSFFTRLDNQLMELGDSSLMQTLKGTKRVWPFLGFNEDLETFRTIADAFGSFDLLLNCTLHVHRSEEMLLGDPSGFSDFQSLLLETKIERGRCLQYLKHWSLTFDQYLTNGRVQHGLLFDSSVCILQIWRITTKIFLSIRLTDAEERWDQFHEAFSIIVTLAEAFVEASNPTKTLYEGIESFSFQLGFLSPLFLTSVRCRDWAIRRRAYNILSSLRRYEGL